MWVALWQSILHLLQCPCIQHCQSHGSGALSNDKRGFRGRFSALPGHAPWHTSLPPGEGQPTGSPTKAPLPKWFIGVPKRRTVFTRHDGKDWRKQRPKVLYPLFSSCKCLRVCRDRMKGPGRLRGRHALKQWWRTWPQAYLAQVWCVSELNKAIAAGVDAAEKWKTVRREIVGRCQQDLLRW